jgi:hypothetical protein
LESCSGYDGNSTLTEEKMTEKETPADMSSEDADDLKHKRLSPAQWEEIKTLWELGEVRLSHIVKKYDISKTAIVRYFKRNGIVGGSRKGEIKSAIISGAAKATIEATVNTFADKRKKRIEDTREAHYTAADFMTRVTNKLIQDAMRDKKSLASIKEDLQALRYAGQIQEQSFNIRMDALNARDEIDENDLPTLTIEDLTESDIQELRLKQDEKDMGDDLLLESIDEEDGDD